MLERTTELAPLRALAAAATAFIALAALSFSDFWQEIELKGFDALSVRTAANQSKLPITIIGIDEPSFAQVQRQWPWPRSLHARLIDQLTKSGALVVALDLQLSEASTPEEDAALAAAIKRAGNVVVASMMAYQESAHARLWMRIDPQDVFRKAGAVSGLAHVEQDTDQVVRRMPDGADVFWREIVNVVNARQPGMLPPVVVPPRPMIRFAGADHTFPYISYYQALDADTALPPDAFRDQIVLVGRDIKASPDAQAGTPDVFGTPFTSTTRWLSPGVELHANALETALRGDAIERAPSWWSAALLALVTVICGFLMRRWRPLLSALVLGGVVTALGALDFFLFTRFNTWLPIFASMFGAILIYVSYGGLAFLTERRRRGEIRRAFSLYVSSEVVDHVMQNPAGLMLGGERQSITVLFSDLAGFTTLSEKLDAEQVARILNQHFSRATAIIKRHGGTVNRFMGDGIMAIWGAPVHDPQQARHACVAACEMQEDIGELRRELAAQGLPEIRMRIGIHSCTAVVGNLGSADRFDYTAIGDGVNLASRLEGVNKLYRTGILVSGDTASQLDGAPAIRPVDRVIVKGKSEAVDIFTPCNDAEATALTTAAIEAYRARRWDESEALWRQVQSRLSGDGVAAVYLDRIVHLRSLAPEAPWESAVELEKL